MLTFGSGELIRSLLSHELIDELRLWIFPLLLGEGKRLFAGDAAPGGLTLAQAKSFSTGVVLQRYQRAGKPSFGSFLNHNPPAVELERRRRFAETEA
jgi:dihydrofolate reductase